MAKRLICRICGGTRNRPRLIYPEAFGRPARCTGAFHAGDDSDGFTPRHGSE